jgi:glycosyltransferase involved in cell wall biosynthesis
LGWTTVTVVAHRRPDVSTEPFVRSSPVHAIDPDMGSIPPTYGMLSTFPPTPCGIATFAAALSTGLIANGAAVDVVRCGQSPDIEDALVVAAVDRDGAFAAVDALNQTDAAIVQHEYGIYDGPDGDSVIDVLRSLLVPAIVVAHTVPRAPTSRQRSVLEEVCDEASAVVVMTETARDRLLASFDVDASRISVIAHGAAVPRDDSPPPGRNRLLTWGLLGPGKGLEWAIDAMASLRDLQPQVRYVIAGATHPKVLAHAGEAYREMLIRRSWGNGTSPSITFDDDYRDLTALAALIADSDLVVLPYDSEDQVTSGVLVDAIAAGRPVVATAFPHAVELLASGAGIVVPQRDPVALAAAIGAVLTDGERAADMAAEARRLAPGLAWTAVAAQYAALAEDLLRVSSSSR